MKIQTLLLSAALVAALAACKPSTSVDTGAGNISAGIGDRELTIKADGQPNAKISVDGDLTINGKAVALNPQQRTLVTAYHHELQGIINAGIAVGKQGGQLAGKAVGAAISGVLSGKTDDIDKKIESEAKKIEAEANRICTHLAGLKTAQDALAAQVPEFRPYANLDQHDIDDCGKEDDVVVNR